MSPRITRGIGSNSSTDNQISIATGGSDGALRSAARAANRANDNDSGSSGGSQPRPSRGGNSGSSGSSSSSSSSSNSSSDRSRGSSSAGVGSSSGNSGSNYTSPAAGRQDERVRIEEDLPAIPTQDPFTTESYFAAGESQTEPEGGEEEAPAESIINEQVSERVSQLSEGFTGLQEQLAMLSMGEEAEGDSGGMSGLVIAAVAVAGAALLGSRYGGE